MISKAVRDKLLHDILEARLEVTQLAQAHHLTVSELASWVRQPEILDCLRGLRQLADTQTQLLASRYRTMAVSQLLKIATVLDEHDNKPDIARKACVDLLQLNLLGDDSSGDMTMQDFSPPLRDLLYHRAEEVKALESRD